MKIVLIDLVDVINHATNLEVLKKLRWIRNGDAKTISIAPLDIGHHAISLCEKLSAKGFRNNTIFLLIAPGNILTNPYILERIEYPQEASYWCGIMENDRSSWREQGIILPPSIDVSSVLELVRRAYEGQNRYVRSVSLGIDYISTRIKLMEAAAIYEIEEMALWEAIGDDEPLTIVVDPYKFYTSISGHDVIFNSIRGIHDYLNSQADLVVRQIIN